MYRLTTRGKLVVGYVLGIFILVGQCVIWGDNSGVGPIFRSFNIVLGICFIILCTPLYFIIKHFISEENQQDEFYRGEAWLLQTVEKLSLLDVILLSGLPVVWIIYMLFNWARKNVLVEGVFIEKVED